MPKTKKKRVVKRKAKGKAKSIVSGGSYPIRGGKMNSGGAPYFITIPQQEQVAPQFLGEFREAMADYRQLGSEISGALRAWSPTAQVGRQVATQLAGAAVPGVVTLASYLMSRGEEAAKTGAAQATAAEAPAQATAQQETKTAHMQAEAKAAYDQARAKQAVKTAEINAEAEAAPEQAKAAQDIKIAKENAEAEAKGAQFFEKVGIAKDIFTNVTADALEEFTSKIESTVEEKLQYDPSKPKIRGSWQQAADLSKQGKAQMAAKKKKADKDREIIEKLEGLRQPKRGIDPEKRNQLTGTFLPTPQQTVSTMATAYGLYRGYQAVNYR